MKKVKFFLAMLAIALFAVACEKNDETISPAEVISGNYEGTLSLSVMDTEQGSFQTQVIINRINDESVKVTLKGDPNAEGAMAIKGDIAVENVTVSASGDTSYTLAETSIDTMVGTTNYKGSLSGTIMGTEADLTFTLTPGAMPMAITAVFMGKK